MALSSLALSRGGAGVAQGVHGMCVLYLRCVMEDDTQRLMHSDSLVFWDTISFTRQGEERTWARVPQRRVPTDGPSVD